MQDARSPKCFEAAFSGVPSREHATTIELEKVSTAPLPSQRYSQQQ